ncbi:MAG: hypothetical protein DSM106950_31255 [Stigonema ocellatum SAG 48.90 = DSM 106950]|nr:hypothetical protein [Stigonema ocellatum SAG 48.90 = DSM 106950]
MRSEVFGVWCLVFGVWFQTTTNNQQPTNNKQPTTNNQQFIYSAYD